MISREFADKLVELVAQKNLDESRNLEWVIYGDYHLYENELTQDDMTLLNILIHAHSPTTIGLANLGLNDDQLILLLEALQQNSSVKNLYLPFNAITDVGAEALAKFLMKKNCGIKRLKIFANTITTKGVSGIANALIANTSLFELEIFCNPFDVKVADDFVRCMKHNRDLEILTLFAPNGRTQLPEFILEKLEANALHHHRMASDARTSSLFANGKREKSLNHSYESSPLNSSETSSDDINPLAAPTLK